MLRLNYVGSTGGSTDNSGLLLGKAGFDDVKDVRPTLLILLGGGWWIMGLICSNFV